ncbi:MAG: sigma factor-like helix-turn-helix DNA-binding protein [Dyella sp.]
MLAAIATLPLPQREAFLLKAEGALSLEEIAQITDSSRATVKSRLRYASTKLRAALEPWR